VADDLSDQISENAKSPKSGEVDGVRFEQHSLRDQIEADRYLASKSASNRTQLPVRVYRTRAPGGTGI